MGKKIVVTETFNVDHLFEGKLTDFYGKIKDIVEEGIQKHGWTDLWLGECTIELDSEPYGYDGGRDLIVTTKRLETDAEYNKRMENNAANKKQLKDQKEKQKQKDLAELARLTKKYGKVAQA